MIRKTTENDIVFFNEVRNECSKYLHDKSTHTLEEARLHEHDLRGIALPLYSFRNNDKEIIFMKSDMRGEEYHFKNIPVLTHIGRGSTRGFYSDQIVIMWRERVAEWLQELQYSEER